MDESVHVLGRSWGEIVDDNERPIVDTKTIIMDLEFFFRWCYILFPGFGEQFNAWINSVLPLAGNKLDVSWD